MENSVAVVFNGGGYRAGAHIGLLQFLEEQELHISAVSGSSAGAVVAIAHAAGYKAKDILDIFRKVDLFSWEYFSMKKPGLFDLEKMGKDLRAIFDVRTFEELQIPCFITATNLIKAREEVFHSGDLILPLLASCSYPMLFAPVKIKNELYADGGIMNNFPIEPIKNKYKLIFAMDILPLKAVTPEALDTSVEILARVMELIYKQKTLPQYENCQLVMAPKKLEGLRIFDEDVAEQAFEIGYEEAVNHRDEILSIFQQAEQEV